MGNTIDVDNKDVSKTNDDYTEGISAEDSLLMQWMVFVIKKLQHNKSIDHLDQQLAMRFQALVDKAPVTLADSKIQKLTAELDEVRRIVKAQEKVATYFFFLDDEGNRAPLKPLERYYYDKRWSSLQEIEHLR